MSLKACWAESDLRGVVLVYAYVARGRERFLGTSEYFTRSCSRVDDPGIGVQI